MYAGVWVCEAKCLVPWVMREFDAIAANRKFHLTEGVVVVTRVEYDVSHETSSVITEPQLYGRDEDKEKIVKFLVEDVCDIEVKPHAEKWKCTPIGNYEKLAEIYGKDRATGVGAETAKEKVRRWANSSNNDHVDRIEVIDELVQQNEANLESFVVDEDDVVLSPKSGTSSKAKKRKLSNDGERDVDILKTALQDIASAIREGNASMEKFQGCFPRGELHKALEEIGIAPHLFTEAYLPRNLRG
ncbi:Disease resistance protein RGA2 [Camellia lanceoleosa]|uniref:Disease resistance protein RGA2 n=1 Tax=Camellia lanceoleosa TaxID=1840588 RepID=A0ACC0I2V9_9ERIC|nr:Disease resistance protein RGA2 [Camellia lanceoleosa]